MGFCLIYLGLAAVIALVFFIYVLKRKFISGFSALLTFSFMAFTASYAQTITKHSFQIMDLIRFSISKNYYLQVVADQKEKTQRFSWGSGGFLGTNFFYTLVYNPGGPYASSTSAKHEGCSATVSELRNDFYVESEICQ